MAQVCERDICLDSTFCPPAAVVISNLRQASSGEVLLIKASECQVKMVEEVAEHLGAEVIQKQRKGRATLIWIAKR